MPRELEQQRDDRQPARAHFKHHTIPPHSGGPKGDKLSQAVGDGEACIWRLATIGPDPPLLPPQDRSEWHMRVKRASQYPKPPVVQPNSELFGT